MSKAVAKRRNQSPSVNYKQLVGETVVMARQFYSRSLEFYWNLGAKVEELTSQHDKYGKQSVEKFSQDLFEAGKIRLGKESLYDAQSIKKNFTEKQLQMAQEATLSLRKALLLCSKNVTPEVRNAILEEAVKSMQKPAAFDVKDALAKRLGSGKPAEVDQDAKNMSQAVRVVKNSENLILLFEQKLKAIGRYVETICYGDDPDRMKRAYEHFDAGNSAFESLVGTWNTQRDLAKEAFERVAEVVKPPKPKKGKKR